MKKPFSLLSIFLLLSSLSSFRQLNGIAWSEMKQFLSEFRKHPTTVGAFAPCSSYVGKEITKYIVNCAENQKPTRTIRVLEVGAGTGSLTKELEHIINRHPSVDIDVDVVEISPIFCEILNKKFSSHQHISINCASILDWKSPYSYDFIICTLPFNSFESESMKTIINHLKHLLSSKGIISYVAYAGIADIKKYFLWGKAKKEHLEKVNVIKSMRKKYQIDARTVIANCPPIRIYHLQIA